MASIIRSESFLCTAQETLNGQIKDFLLFRGWVLSCDFPDSRWRYCKRFNRHELSLTLQEAFKVECTSRGQDL